MAVAISKQTDRDIIVALKEQTTIGTTVSGSGAEKIRFSPSPGATLTTNQIASTESRNDGLARAPKAGRVTVPGTYNGPAALSAYDTLDAAVMRSTWTASSTIQQSDVSSATASISSNVLTISTGSLITAGLRRMMVVTLSTGFLAGNQSRRCFVTALTAATATLTPVDGAALTDEAGPIASWTIIVHNTIVQGTTDCAFTVEQYRGQIDRSELVDWARFGVHSWTINADNEVQRSFQLLGRNMSILATGASPNFTSPTEYTGEAFVSPHCKAVIGSSVVVGLVNFQFTNNINLFRDQSVDKLTAEIGVGQPAITASIEILEDDLSRVEAYLNGTETTLGIYMPLPGTGAVDFQALSFTKVRYLGADPSGLGADRFSSRTFPLAIDADLTGGANSATMYRLTDSVIA